MRRRSRMKIPDDPNYEEEELDEDHHVVGNNHLW